MRLAALLIAWLTLGSSDADACKHGTPAPYVLSPRTHDVIAPSMPVVEWELNEPTLPEYLPFGCASIGTVVLKVSASDDQTPTANLGYLIAIRGRGSMMRFGAEPVQPRDNGTFVLPYRDELQLEIDIQAVDRNGNVGPMTTIVIDTVTRQAYLVIAQMALAVLTVLIVIGHRIIVIRRRRRSR